MLRELVGVLERRAPDGSFVFSDDDLRAVLPMLYLGLLEAFPDVALPPSAMTAIGELSRAAGVTTSDAADVARAKLQRHIDDMTVGAALRDELERAMRGALGSGNLDAARALADVLGVEVSRAPLGSVTRPAGTIPAGPAARFAALGVTSKKP